MNFVQKLIDDTKSGLWDFAWKYSDASQNYNFNKEKHLLRGMNFSLTEPKTMIFPNGYAIYYNEDLMKNLAKEIDISLERTIDESIAVAPFDTKHAVIDRAFSISPRRNYFIAQNTQIHRTTHTTEGAHCFYLMTGLSNFLVGQSACGTSFDTLSTGFTIGFYKLAAPRRRDSSIKTTAHKL